MEVSDVPEAEVSWPAKLRQQEELRPSGSRPECHICSAGKFDAFGFGEGATGGGFQGSFSDLGISINSCHVQLRIRRLPELSEFFEFSCCLHFNLPSYLKISSRSTSNANGGYVHSLYGALGSSLGGLFLFVSGHRQVGTASGY